MFGFGNKGKWIDVEKHVTEVNVMILGTKMREDHGIVVFQYNDKTFAHRAIIKAEGIQDTVIDADIAEMRLHLSVKWPEV
jgi:hypothetical protein